MTLLTPSLRYVLGLSPSIIILVAALVWILKDQSRSRVRKAAVAIQVTAFVSFIEFLVYHPGFKVLPLALYLKAMTLGFVVDAVGWRKEKGTQVAD